MTKQENDDNRHHPNVPSLRFRGFTDPWQRKRLGEITRVVKRKNTDLVTSRPLTISAQYGMIDQTEFFSKVIASDDLRTYYLIERGEFAYNRSYSQDYPWGTIKRLDKYDSGALSTLYTCFALKGIESEFMVHYFETTKWYKQIQMIAAEGARNHGLLNIPSSDFFDTYHILPSSLAEQEKIGTFFRALDELIAAREEELEKLRQMKAALLDAMFPSDAPMERVTSATAHTLYDSLLDHTLREWNIVPSETCTPHTPRLRFRGFTDPWQRTQLGNVFHLKTDRVDLRDLSTVRYISTEDMLQDFQGVTPSSNPPMSYSVVRFSKGDILMANIRPYLKKVWLADSEGGCSTDVIVFSPKDSHNSRFLYHELANDRFIEYVMDGAQGIKMPRGNKETMKDYTLYVPSLAEQKQIGAFFRSQDEGIATATELIDKLKRIKQACLKQMFV